MARRERVRFRPGDLVFARFHGEEEFEIINYCMCWLYFGPGCKLLKDKDDIIHKECKAQNY